MKSVFRYLKPFALGIALAVALLFLQAMADLSLPNYMSDIVNVGLQQGGLSHAAPDAISENGMKLMTSFMNDDERAAVTAGYQPIAADSAEFAAYAAAYPEASGTVYIRTADAAGALDDAFGAATWTMINVAKGMGGGAPMMSSSDGVDIELAYRMLPMIALIPASTIEAAHEQALTNDAAILAQSGISMSKAFYRELGADLTAIQNGYIWRIGLMMLGVALAGGVATVLVSLLASRVSSGFARDLRAALFGRIESFASDEFDRFSTASLITRCTNDVTQVQMLSMMAIRMLFYAPIMAIGGAIMALNKAVSMTWVIALAVVILVLLISVIMRIATPRFKAIQKLVDRLNLVTREHLTGLMVIRAFRTQAHEKERFEEVNDQLTRTSLFINRVMTAMWPAMSLIMSGTTLLIVWVGSRQIAQSSMQVGDMMAFMQYAMQIIMSFLMISMMFVFLPRAAVSIERIGEVLNTRPSIADPVHPKQADPAQAGTVELRHVSFRYRGAEEDALSDLSFIARPGQTTAIIGSTGSGKSTVASLILRFYDVSEGQVLVDGVDVREMTQKDLRSRIGYVPQRGVLLSGTVASNLRYGRPDATDEEIAVAARVAQADSFIEEKPDGYQAEIAQGGTNVSGGQRQRLSIARALNKNPEILIFDDSFSALDFRTDVRLRRALRAHTADSTLIIVAQRVGTIMHAEQIIVL
ncbi:MAG: ABC transporter ATP-binding protein, partial [Clostridiales bacterium]|nr:ABC transporter ATP-binding protein [Clostridiales bacterium]